jgi:hypothetical protein
MRKGLAMLQPPPELELADINRIVDEAVEGLDPVQQDAMRRCLLGVYRLGAAVMRRQLLERLAAGQEKIEDDLQNMKVKGIA